MNPQATPTAPPFTIRHGESRIIFFMGTCVFLSATADPGSGDVNDPPSSSTNNSRIASIGCLGIDRGFGSDGAQFVGAHQIP